MEHVLDWALYNGLILDKNIIVWGEIKSHYNLIPNNTDILIAHGSPYGILDRHIQ